ncbi:MAG: hypothetical protein ABIG39_05275 [Candidatus Micrarchaeota archaeon]
MDWKELLKDKKKINTYFIVLSFIFSILFAIVIVSCPHDENWKFWTYATFVLFGLSFIIALITNMLLFAEVYVKSGIRAGILSLTIVIVVIGYLGLFSCGGPPEVCTMPAGMTCPKSYLSSESDTLKITLVNGLAKKMIVSSVSCTKDPEQYGKRSYNPYADVTMGIGESHDFELVCTDKAGSPLGFEQGESYSGRINIEYYFEDEGVDNLRTLSGNIFVVAG